MKVGQAMSAMEAALPEQLVGPYREALVRLQEAAPAMPTALVHQQLDTAFGPGWRRLLASFDDLPVAAASVGQVHRATWSDGTPVAVKVQYPGAAEALVADLRVLQTLVPIMQDRKSTRLNSSHVNISYAVFCLKKKNKPNIAVCFAPLS